MARPLLVGESNPYGRDPRYALFPLPLGSVGARLCRTVLDLEIGQYLKLFDRANLLELGRDGKWKVREAELAARGLLLMREVSPLVLLGTRVANAFTAHDPAPYSSWTFTDERDREWRALYLPHPSGRSRAWNVEGAFERARLLVKQHCGLDW